MPSNHDHKNLYRIARGAVAIGALAAAIWSPVSASARQASGKAAERPQISWHSQVIKTKHGVAGSHDCRVVVTASVGVAVVKFSSPGHPKVQVSGRRVGGSAMSPRQTYSCRIDTRRAVDPSVPVQVTATSSSGASASVTATAVPAESAAGETSSSTATSGTGSGASSKPTAPETEVVSAPEAPATETPAPVTETSAPVTETPAVTETTPPPAETPSAPPATETSTPSQPSSEASQPAANADQLFSPSSFWNRQLSASAPLVSNSSAYVQELVHLVSQTGSWINTNEYSTPVYVVGADQPTSKVTIVPEDGSAVDPRQQAALEAVPIPSNAVPAKGTDRHLVVWQPSTDKMWEFWEMRNQNGHWTTDSSGAMDNVSTNVGYYNSEAWTGAQSWWGATATSLPLLGGLIRISELRSGTIDHALAMAIPNASSSHVWPAQRSDGHNTSSTAIPEGTTFRLPASLNIAALGLPPAAQAIAYAAQKYGIIVRDGSADVSLYAEDPTPLGSNPYGQLFSNMYPNALLAKFPWSSLVAVQQSH